jgi:hypothetical protein
MENAANYDITKGPMEMREMRAYRNSIRIRNMTLVKAKIIKKPEKRCWWPLTAMDLSRNCS